MGAAVIVTDMELKPFQEEAVEVMVGRGSVLLALTMGLGKSFTTIAALEELNENGAVKTGLIIVPSSLKFQWQTEIRKITGRLALVIDGNKATREMLYRHACRYMYVITNYESIVNDWNIVRDLDLDYIVCDEATALKSFTAKRSKKVKFLGKRTPVRFALTGQPIENRPEELFSIMEFVDPTVLGDFRKFDRTFIVRDHWGRPKRSRNLPLLQTTMADVMYRKARKDVADQFPQVNAAMRPFYLSPLEASLYERVAHQTIELIDKATGQFGSGFSLEAHYGAAEGSASEKMRGDIMSGMLLLRLIANDPRLVIESAKKYTDGRKGEGSKLAAELVEAGWFDKVPDVSTKRAMFKEYLDEILADDEESKVVAFTTFKGLIRSIAADTSDITNCTILDGDMAARDRHKSVEKFKSDPKTRLFLSSDAGGYGIDLPNANHLCSLDLPWSAGAYDQREARIIRISSEWEQVFIAMLLAHGTLDMRMSQMIVEKGDIASAWLDGGYDEKGKHELTLGSLRDFLATASLRP